VIRKDEQKRSEWAHFVRNPLISIVKSRRGRRGRKSVGGVEGRSRSGKKILKKNVQFIALCPGGKGGEGRKKKVFHSPSTMKREHLASF